MSKSSSSKKAQPGVIDESFEDDKNNQEAESDEDSHSSSSDEDQDDDEPEVVQEDCEQSSKPSKDVQPNVKKSKSSVTVSKTDKREAQFRLASRLSKAR